MHRLNLNGYEPDRHHEAAVAFCIHAGTDELTWMYTANTTDVALLKRAHKKMVKAVDSAWEGRADVHHIQTSPGRQ